MAVPVRVKEGGIELTPVEKQIFDLLFQVARSCACKPQLRVAGGWIRDKLLGKDSSDIDITIDNMLGTEFCKYIPHGDFQQIQSNPEKSKHLETTRMKLLGVPIDFANLRCEEDYSDEGSRIPKHMRFGTAKQDAYRRDLTINSLFYNIEHHLVEDLTGRGISDLKSGIIRTPAAAQANFLDDPLRVLRAIRFAARFGFVLDQELMEAASDEEVKFSFRNKISKERIGGEIDLMFKLHGYLPVKAMIYICDLQLFRDVFELPPGIEILLPSVCVAALGSASRLIVSNEAIIIGQEDQRRRRLLLLLLYAALFLPFRDKVDKETNKTLVSYIITNSKLSSVPKMLI